jgi:ascorbate-specific PTS system EIIC-type component UlaA
MKHVISNLVGIAIMTALIAGAFYPEPYIGPYGVPYDGYAVDLGIKRAAWFGTMLLGFLQVVVMIWIINLFSTQEKLEVSERSKTYFEISKIKISVLTYISNFLDLVLAFGCVFSGWYFLAIVWLFVSLLQFSITKHRLDYRKKMEAVEV